MSDPQKVGGSPRPGNEPPSRSITPPIIAADLPELHAVGPDADRRRVILEQILGAVDPLGLVAEVLDAVDHALAAARARESSV